MMLKLLTFYFTIKGIVHPKRKILSLIGRVRELSECIKNILICVLKMNGLTGLERHEGE